MSPTPIATSLVIEVGAMPLEKNKMLNVLLRISSPRFSRVVSHDSYQFLTTCHDLVQTVGLLE